MAAASAVLFHEKAWPEQLRSAANELYTLFSDLSGIGDDSLDPLQNEGTTLAAGTAISPRDAAVCVLDFQRTVQFLRGIERAVRLLKDRFEGERIEMLYAGCGPFATLAVPLCTRFAPTELRFTLLDAHSTSLDAAQSVVKALDLNDYFEAFVECDITAYRLPPDKPVHLIVCETMQKALDLEPQVAATLNLAPQLRTGGVFVPRRVSVELCMADQGREISLESSPSHVIDAPKDRIPVQQLLELSQITAQSLADSLGSGDGTSQFLPPTTVRVPELPSRHYTATLMTHVLVFDTFSLGDYHSGISTPKALHELGLLQGGESLEFQYVLGSEPGFVCRKVG